MEEQPNRSEAGDRTVVDELRELGQSLSALGQTAFKGGRVLSVELLRSVRSDRGPGARRDRASRPRRRRGRPNEPPDTLSVAGAAVLRRVAGVGLCELERPDARASRRSRPGRRPRVRAAGHGRRGLSRHGQLVPRLRGARRGRDGALSLPGHRAAVPAIPGRRERPDHPGRQQPSGDPSDRLSRRNGTTIDKPRSRALEPGGVPKGP